MRDVGFEQFDTVAGGETAGIPYAAWIADKLGLPMAYIRKKPKGFGRNSLIEGDVPGQAAFLLTKRTPRLRAHGGHGRPRRIRRLCRWSG